MTILVIALVGGLFLLAWSANWFVDGAAATARHVGMPPLVIGMVVVGFGTSAPEMSLSALEGTPGIAPGNAYGSNITNIGLILGLAAILRPIVVPSRVLRKELPLLLGTTAIAAWQLHDEDLTRTEAVLLLGVFVALMGWTVWQGLRGRPDALGRRWTRSLLGIPCR